MKKFNLIKVYTLFFIIVSINYISPMNDGSDGKEIDLSDWLNSIEGTSESLARQTCNLRDSRLSASVQSNDSNQPRTNELPQDNNIKKPLSCADCKLTIYTWKEWQLHMNRTHPDQRPYKCLTCQFDSNAQKELAKHIKKEHHGKKKYPCPICDYAGDSKSHLKVHIREEHRLLKNRANQQESLNESADKQVSAQTFHSEQEVLNAEANAQAQEIRSIILCPECRMQLDTYNDWKLHVQAQHPDVKRYKCRSCEHKDTNEYLLAAHIKEKHPNNPPFICPFCDFSTNTVMSLSQHIGRDHMKQLYKCDQLHCDYVGHTDDMINHKKNTHNIIEVKFPENFSCPIGCKDNLLNWKTWQNHMQIQHSDIKLYKCRSCKFDTNIQEDLAKHIKNNHQESPYPCPFCKSVLKTYDTFYKHIERVHIKERKYKCEF